jgi:hypothetical protein
MSKKIFTFSVLPLFSRSRDHLRTNLLSQTQTDTVPVFLLTGTRCKEVSCSTFRERAKFDPLTKNLSLGQAHSVRMGSEIGQDLPVQQHMY